MLLFSPFRKRARSFFLNPRMFCAKFFEICPVVLEKKMSMYFHFVSIISLWQRAWPFIRTNLNCLHLGVLYVKYGGTWLGDSEEVNTWKDIDGHLNRQTQIDKNNRCFAKHYWAFAWSLSGQILANYVKCFENTGILGLILQWPWQKT